MKPLPFLSSLVFSLLTGFCLVSTSAAQQTATQSAIPSLTACQVRVRQLSSTPAHLDQLKPESLPDVLTEIDVCVLNHPRLTRAELLSAYKARVNVEEEIKRRASEQEVSQKQGAESCFNDLKPTVAEGLKPADNRFVNVTDQSLEKQNGRAFECVKAFGNDQRVSLSAYLATVVIQGERYHRVAVTFDQRVRANGEAMANRYNADTADLANKLSALRKEYIAHLDKDVRMYEQLRREQRAEDLATALNSLFQSTSASRSSPQVQQIYQPPQQMHCTTQTIPPAVPGLSSWAYTSCH